MSKIETYFANVIIMVNVFKYLAKSEATVHMCSLKKLFWSISYNSKKNGVFFWKVGQIEPPPPNFYFKKN